MAGRDRKVAGHWRLAGGPAARLGMGSTRRWSARVPSVFAAAAMHGAIDGHAIGAREKRPTFRAIGFERTVMTL